MARNNNRQQESTTPELQERVVFINRPVRAIMELAGVQNVITKSLGTDNAMNIVKAAAEGLKNMESPVQVAERRGISVAEMFGGKEN